MKRLLILTMLALVTALSGCAGGWPRLPWYRGANCQSCATSYDTTSAPVYGGTILPGPSLPAELPGPVDSPTM
jgi:hypothetical protein